MSEKNVHDPGSHLTLDSAYHLVEQVILKLFSGQNNIIEKKY